MTTDALGYYRILECTPQTDEHTLKLCYRDAAKRWHPDHNQSADAVENFQRISVAYAVLSNPKTRLIYQLLSLVYGAKDFPDMNTLKIYTSAKGEQTPYLRVFKVSETLIGKRGVRVDEQNLIGTVQDAERLIGQATRHNWLNGWWHPKAVKLNIKAIRANLSASTLNQADNLKMLVHNTAAYFANDHLVEASLSLKQAEMFTTPSVRDEIRAFQAFFPSVEATVPQWNAERLMKVQLVYPHRLLISIGVLATVVLLGIFSGNLWTYIPEKIHYYQKVNFSNGAQTVDDMAVSKVFNIPVDTTDVKMLYYATDSVDVMYGPGEEFDKMGKLKLRQTVRLTGYTADREWFRVMLDNGEMGFIKKNSLKQGIGREIPTDSRIFQNEM